MRIEWNLLSTQSFWGAKIYHIHNFLIQLLERIGEYIGRLAKEVFRTQFTWATGHFLGFLS